MHAVDCQVQLFGTPWAVAPQASLSIGFSRQEYWKGLPCPSPEDLPNPGTEPTSLMSPTLASVFFTTGATWEAQTLSRSLNQNQRLLAGMSDYASDCLNPLFRHECMEKQE